MKIKSLWNYQRRKTRKIIETLFSQLCDQQLLKRNYAKTSEGLFARIVAKIASVSILKAIKQTDRSNKTYTLYLTAQRVKYRLLILLILSAASLQAQNSEIDIHQIALHSSSIKSDGLLPGASFEECVRVLGNPHSISDYNSEIDEDTMKIYRYGKYNLYFLKGKLDTWHLLDSSLEVGQVSGRKFKVGDKLVPITGKPLDFHGFAITDYEGESQNMPFKSGSVNGIRNGDTSLDSIFELLFDSKGNLFSISKIDR